MVLNPGKCTLVKKLMTLLNFNEMAMKNGEGEVEQVKILGIT